MYRRHERLCLHDLLRNVNMVRFELITEQELDLDREFKCCSVPPKLSAGIEVISSYNLYQKFSPFTLIKREKILAAKPGISIICRLWPTLF